ncbi:MAG: hypothetical protein CSA34_05980 [Desulfobulbus propionicus]|nr:MAG: hypothetical protein CSA34_05980 [Desulfobulbus propionicus]
MAFCWLAIILGAPFFFYGGPGYYSSRSFKAAWDLGHVLFFFLGSSLLWSRVRGQQQKRSLWHAAGLLFGVVLLAGIGIELVQQRLGGRSVSFFDLLRNMLGCLAAFCWLILPREVAGSGMHGTVWRRVVLTAAGITFFLLIFTAVPLSRALLDEHRARKQFPVLSDFQSSMEVERWQGRVHYDRQMARHGKGAMRVQLTTAKYSGASLMYFPHDWRDFTWLCLSVFKVDEEPMCLHCRIHDSNHGDHGRVFTDRFLQRFELQQGWNDLQISLDAVRKSPATRLMDMAQIEGLGFFVTRQQRPRTIYIDHVYLVR